MGRAARALAGGIGIGLLGWLLYAASAWTRYGSRHAARGIGGEDPLDALLPTREVEELHETSVRVTAPAAVAIAKEVDLQRSPPIRALLGIRTLPTRLRGKAEPRAARGLVEETRAIGWGVLADRPDYYASGAVTRPWQGEVEFRGLPPEEFSVFAEPGYAKIVWTLEADDDRNGGAILRTRTLVATTDAEARRRFRLYWAIFSPGILLIRHAALRLVRREAEREAARAAR
jgi:hypothetical protein